VFAFELAATPFQALAAFFSRPLRGIRRKRFIRKEILQN